MRRFKFWPSVKKNYEEQGEIFFTCRRYGRLRLEEKQKVDRLICQAGEEYANALREYLLTDRECQAVCRRWYIAENTLRRCVRRFYEAW